MPAAFADVAKSEYILLTTFTKDGKPKPTTVWGVPEGDKGEPVEAVARMLPDSETREVFDKVTKR